MSDQSSSLENTQPHGGIAKRVGAFIRHPRLPDNPGTLRNGGWGEVVRLYALDMALMLVVLGALLAAEMVGYNLPSNELEDIDLNLAWIAVIVIGAPVAEELAFRGWLSGKLGAMIASPMAALGGFLVVGAIVQPQYASIAIAGAVLMVLAAGIAWWLRKPGPYRWFRFAFPLFFWVSALGFAAIHIGNYEDTSQVLWPLVIPQFIAGILFAYARLKHGLLSAMLLHAMHNGTFVALVATGEALGGA